MQLLFVVDFRLQAILLQFVRAFGKRFGRHDVGGFVDQIARRVDAFRQRKISVVPALRRLRLLGQNEKLFDCNRLFDFRFVFRKAVGRYFRAESDGRGGQIVNGERDGCFTLGQNSIGGISPDFFCFQFAQLFFFAQTDAQQPLDGQIVQRGKAVRFAEFAVKAVTLQSARHAPVHYGVDFFGCFGQRDVFVNADNQNAVA